MIQKNLEDEASYYAMSKNVESIAQLGWFFMALLLEAVIFEAVER